MDKVYRERKIEDKFRASYEQQYENSTGAELASPYRLCDRMYEITT